MAPRAVLTVGHSTHPLDEFVGLVREAGVARIVDVRSFPRSRRVPWTNTEVLAAELPAAGVDYVHVPELGGRRRGTADSPNGGWEHPSFRAYADHLATPEFARGLERLLALAGERTTAVMCAEAPWWRCHRRLIADALLVRGIPVRHLMPGGRLNDHELTSFAVVDGERLTYPPAQESLDV